MPRWAIITGYVVRARYAGVDKLEAQGRVKDFNPAKLKTNGFAAVNPLAMASRW